MELYRRCWRILSDAINRTWLIEWLVNSAPAQAFLRKTAISAGLGKLAGRGFRRSVAESRRRQALPCLESLADKGGADTHFRGDFPHGEPALVQLCETVVVEH